MIDFFLKKEAHAKRFPDKIVRNDMALTQPMVIHFNTLTSWLGAPCGAHASISQIIYNTKIEKCWCVAKGAKTLDIYLF